MAIDTQPQSSDAEAMDELLTYEFVCTLEEVPEGSRKCTLLPSSKRSVLLLNVDGEIHCMDQACYHHGGPLVNGDIEELGGKVTIKCPWHAYHIAVATGEGLYKGMEMVMGPSGKFEPVPGTVKSKGVKQRTHFVEIRNGNEIFVADSSKIPGNVLIESDIYAFKEFKIPGKAKPGEVRVHSRFE